MTMVSRRQSSRRCLEVAALHLANYSEAGTEVRDETSGALLKIYFDQIAVVLVWKPQKGRPGLVSFVQNGKQVYQVSEHTAGSCDKAWRVARALASMLETEVVSWDRGSLNARRAQLILLA